MRTLLHFQWGVVLGILHGFFASANAAGVVPSFTTGTVTSETSTRTEVVEIIRQVEYRTGEIYSVSGSNINIPTNPTPDAEYTIITPGAPFQFSESFTGPGIASETVIERSVITDSTTMSTSVFTQ